LADKSWLKVLLADLLWEKNTVPWLITSSEQAAIHAKTVEEGVWEWPSK
jgi:hypothetical protein